ncbi:PREDICTED: DNA damage-inducible transcript 3 protein [Phaethon lepturus]|uniref:DNA damage-inducible transcript 3 protein n=1 Tax=Phaethon lepturus TaxID=97097 RepID=UPI0005309104|nr:PREDICTED: DNA damage-inducible transcript 3 protein [Phaethon lepturus]
MAAEGLPAGGPTGALPGWELEAWYQDLQEVLAAAEEPCEPSPPWGVEQAELAPLWGREGDGSGPEDCELDAALAVELLELLGPESTVGTEPAGLPASASSRSSPPRLGTEEDEAAAAAGHGVKRKRYGGPAASRELAKRREWASEQQVLELTAHNEQLREEIQRLSAEVERTRAALIDHIVNLHQA